jgi:hypothetical protein
MRWTPEKDQLVSSPFSPSTLIEVQSNPSNQLLLKILETHQLAVDTKRVAEAWREFSHPSTPKTLYPALSNMVVLT